MPKNLFISYSHADTSHKDALIKFLITLKRENIIGHWCDRDLICGDNLDVEIFHELENADIIVLLISQDFLSSYYCYEVELNKALEDAKQVNKRIFPVIVETCDWKNTPIKAYVALPQDGTPVSKHQDQNDAWLQIIKDIRKYASTAVVQQPTNVGKITYKLEQAWEEYLNSTDIVFLHEHKEAIELDDIYIFPDFKKLDYELDKYELIVSSEKYTDINYVGNATLILGTEQIGKSTFAKKIFRNFFQKGNFPLYIEGTNIDDTKFEDIVKKCLTRQYENLDVSAYNGSKNKLLIVDDFHLATLNDKYKQTFIKNAEELFDHIIVISDKSIQFNEIVYPLFDNYDVLEFQRFNHLLISKLISKWNSLGQEETIDLKELQKNNDRTKHHVDSMLRKNIVPPKPIFILMILQSLESTSSKDYALTSYGHCYQSLIYQSLSKIKIATREFDQYINYLTEMSYFMFSRGGTIISREDYEDFKKDYSLHYVIESHNDAIRNLIASGIIKYRNEEYYFSYKYIFYFYVAKYIAENYSVLGVAIIENLCSKMHYEKYANILIFVTYHTKDQVVFDEILLRTSVIFDGIPEATLDSCEIDHLFDFIKALPELIYEKRSVDEERERSLKNKDSMDKKPTEDSENPMAEDDEAVDEAKYNSESMADTNRSARAVEILGQILKNRFASLKKPQLEELASSSFSVGLRFLNFYLNIVKNFEKEIMAEIEKRITENAGDKKIEKEVKKLYWGLCYGMSISVIKKIAFSVGNENIIEIFDKIQSQTDTLAIRLINITIKLEFTKKIPKEEILELWQEVNAKNIIVRRMLQEILVSHLYLHHVDFDDKSWISSKLEIPMKTQAYIQSDTKQRVIKKH